MATKKINPNFLGQRDKQRYWTNTVSAWYLSGLKLTAFCDKHQIDRASFRRWVRTLTLPRPVTLKPAEQLSAVPAHSQSEGNSGHHSRPFLPVTIASINESFETSPSGMTLRLPSGTHILLEPHFDESALTRLLAVLGEQAC